jgi:hypothetical protein
MKVISVNEANIFLKKIEMQIGEWNAINYVNWVSFKGMTCNYQAPREVRDLLRFCQQISTWLPKSRWKILKIDNSGGMNAIENSFFSGLLYGEKFPPFISSDDALLFEFGDDESENEKIELLISNLIYAILMFESHAQVASSVCNDGELLNVQDGFVYFISKSKEKLIDAQRIIDRYEKNIAPEWITKIIVDEQNKIFNSGSTEESVGDLPAF